MKSVKSLLLAVALAVALVAGSVHVWAQDWRIAWSPATNISNTPPSSNRPTMVADSAGNVHVIWGEDIGGDSVVGIPNALLSESNALVYTRWDGSTWSDPIDIIAVPNDNVAEYPSLAIDSQQNLHLVWTGVSTIYYSRVPAQEAASARAWLPPIPVGNSARTAWESAIAVDAQDVPHILYATRGDDPAVYYTTITEPDLAVETPVRLSLPLERPDEAGLLHLSLNIDSQGRMHALWGTVRVEGFGHSIYYARSVDGGQTWSKATRLAQGERDKANAEWPSLGFVGDSELHLVYTYPANRGRYERISLDGGETWGEPRPILQDVEGIAGWNVQVNDAAGNLHMLANMRTFDQTGGVLYWRWLDGNWSPFQWANVETEATGPGGHFTAATVRLGNEIHVLWNTNLSNQAGEIWHSSGLVPGVSELEPVALPAGAESTSELSTSQDSQAPSDAGALNQPVSSNPEASAEANAEFNETSRSTFNPLASSLVGILPALLLVFGVVAWHLWKKD